MNLRRALFVIGFLVTVASLPAPGEATDWTIGDVLVGIRGGTYQVWRSDGTTAGTVLKEPISDSPTPTGQTAGCAFGRGSSHLYTTNFSNNRVVKFAFGHPHAILQTIDYGPEFLSQSPESIAVDKDGNVYVGNADGDRKIRKYDASGTLLASFSADIENRGTDHIDLAADQKTIFYTSEGRKIKRFHVDDGQLPDFADFTEVAGTFFGLRRLPPGLTVGGVDGFLLVANFLDIKLLDASGNIIATYDATFGEFSSEDGWFALALDPNGTSFWATSLFSGNMYRFNIVTGAIEVGPIFTDADGFGAGAGGLCLVGEPRVAADNDADGVVNVEDTCLNDWNPEQAKCELCRGAEKLAELACPVRGATADTTPSPNTVSQGGPVVLTAIIRPAVTITVPRLDCYNTLWTFFDPETGDPMNGRHRHRLAYGIFQGSPDIITIPANTDYPVVCDQSENYDLPAGTFSYVATFSNDFQDSGIDPETGVCTVPPCVNLSLVTVTSAVDTVTITDATPTTKIQVDIQPGIFPNSRGCQSTSSIPVAVLSTDTFDATWIDADTVRFRKNGTEPGAAEIHTRAGHAVRHVADVNGDGKADMVFHFSVPPTGFSCADVPSGQKSITLNGLLTGKTLASSPPGVTDIAGTDTIRLTPGK